MKAERLNAIYFFKQMLEKKYANNNVVEKDYCDQGEKKTWKCECLDMDKVSKNDQDYSICHIDRLDLTGCDPKSTVGFDV